MKDYIEKALRTEKYDENIKERLTSPRSIRLIHSIMGMQTESAEFTDTIKKHVFYGKEIDTVNLEEELGDLMWYIAVACDELWVSFADICRKNIEKLKLRYPGEFTQEKALNRDIEAERQLLEKDV